MPYHSGRAGSSFLHFGLVYRWADSGSDKWRRLKKDMVTSRNIWERFQKVPEEKVFPNGRLVHDYSEPGHLVIQTEKEGVVEWREKHSEWREQAGKGWECSVACVGWSPWGGKSTRGDRHVQESDYTRLFFFFFLNNNRKFLKAFTWDCRSHSINILKIILVCVSGTGWSARKLPQPSFG